MKLICIAVDPAALNYDELVKDLSSVVRKHGGGGMSPGSVLPVEDFCVGTRYGLNDLTRACRIIMSQVEILEP